MSIEANWVSVAAALAHRTGSLERLRRSWPGLWQKGAASDAVPASLTLYLDLVRWGAAMLVVQYNLKERAFGSDWVVARLPGNGHAYVTIFFVLSGFVIAATVDRKRSRGPLDYALDRASRLYSVAIPVLLICALLSLAWPEVDGASAYGFALSHPVATFAANTLFVGNAWFLDAAPFVNGPYWSLGYEAMYYVAFGVWTFARGPWRWGLLALVALVASPKIALLFPFWLCGVWLYRWRNRVPLSPAAALAVASAAGSGLAKAAYEGFVGCDPAAWLAYPPAAWAVSFVCFGAWIASRWKVAAPDANAGRTVPGFGSGSGATANRRGSR